MLPSSEAVTAKVMELFKEIEPTAYWSNSGVANELTDDSLFEHVPKKHITIDVTWKDLRVVVSYHEVQNFVTVNRFNCFDQSLLMGIPDLQWSAFSSAHQIVFII